jgi:hypothetical protein
VKFPVLAVITATLLLPGSAVADPVLPTEPPVADPPIVLVQAPATIQLARENTKLKKQVAVLKRRTVALHKTLLHQPTVTEAINLSCAIFGSCSTLWRRARCESHLYAGAHNASGASGLFQFLPSTWYSTPFGGFSIWSPYSNALAAGWMNTHGRGGEWVCR